MGKGNLKCLIDNLVLIWNIVEKWKYMKKGENTQYYTFHEFMFFSYIYICINTQGKHLFVGFFSGKRGFTW